jgi:ADP-L-glycero-D-manno-heptose 6-epimerase
VEEYVIVITGGAGFIGSALVWGLNRRGIDDIIVVDHLEESEKWRNLVPLRFADYFDKMEFIEKLEQGYFGKTIDAILHMGACSSTTETNADYFIANNYRYSVRLGLWRESHPQCRFIYASSAATYGSGEAGYKDSEKNLWNLRPLNIYGYSKHLFDIYALKKKWLSSVVGLKYFNVFGPNEDHKGDMRSVINKAYPDVRDKGTMVLFKSHEKAYAHGEQRRDFIYVKDAVAMTLFFLDKTAANGIFNIGTGKARTWNDVAATLFAAAKKKKNIQYIPMPVSLRDTYQYYTCADILKLRKAGCVHPCMSLEYAVRDYVTRYLSVNEHLEPEKE